MKAHSKILLMKKSLQVTVDNNEVPETLPQTPPNEEVPPKYTTAMATMWLGAQSGMLYIHSAIGEWSVCLGRSVIERNLIEGFKMILIRRIQSG